MKRFAKRIVTFFLCVTIVVSTTLTGLAATGYDRGYAGGMAGDGKIYTQGLDVSEWQDGNIDFVSIKNAGYDYVILRAGTTKRKDYNFEEFYASARAAGLNIGAYFYSYATTPSQSTTDANTMLGWLAGKQFEYPIYFDYEDPSQASLSTEVAQAICLNFMDTIANAGYLTGMYTGWWKSTQLPMDVICSKYEAWIAYYAGDGSYDAGYDKKNPEFCTKYGMYQYTSKHYVNGKGPYDANVCYKDYPSIVKKYGFNGYNADSTPEGCLDMVSGRDGFVRVRGWAFDKDDTSKNLEIHVYIGGSAGQPGTEGKIIIADGVREDVNMVHNCGINHGFDASVATTLKGEQPVYVYAIDGTDPTTHTLLGTQTVTLSEDANDPTHGKVKVISSDSNSFTLSCDLTGHANVKSVQFPTWTEEKPDNKKWYDGTVQNGFATCKILIEDFENYQGVYFTDVYITDYAGNLTGIGGFSTSFNLPNSCVDEVTGVSGAIKIRGWAYDKDNIFEHSEVHVYVGGPAGDSRAQLFKVKADKLREDVNYAFGCGAYHGFEDVIYPSLQGEQPVYIYVINTGNGDNVFTEMKTANISVVSTARKGDADRNGKINIADVTLIQKNLSEPFLGKGYDSATDINGNGRVDIRDATYIQLYLAKHIDSLNRVR